MCLTFKSASASVFSKWDNLQQLCWRTPVWSLYTFVRRENKRIKIHCLEVHRHFHCTIPMYCIVQLSTSACCLNKNSCFIYFPCFLLILLHFFFPQFFFFFNYFALKALIVSDPWRNKKRAVLFFWWIRVWSSDLQHNTGLGN